MKHAYAAFRSYLAGQIPPVISGGLIEALKSPFNSFFLAHSIPPVISGGLIEADGREHAPGRGTWTGFRR